MSARAGLRVWITFIVATCVCFAGVWILIPAPAYWLLTFTVGAPELSAWLIASAGAAALVAFADRRRHRLSRITLIIAVSALVLPAWVVGQIPGTVRRFDAAMADALGEGFLASVPADIRDRMRSTPIATSELFGKIATRDVGITRGLQFAAPEGQPLTLDVYRPAIDRPVPVVIQIYGGAWQHGAPGDDATAATALASRGYVVFAIDYRHAPRWRWPAQLDDVQAAMQWVRDHAAGYGGDATRLAVLGRSSGAQLALIAGITAKASAVRAIVLYYSPVSLTEGYRHPPVPDTLDLRQVEEALIGGTLAERPAAYDAASPITYANRPHPPVLLIDGGKDRIVEARFGGMLHDKLRASGRSIFLVLPWADHSFDAVPFGPSAQIARYYTERFLAWALWTR